MLEAAGGISSKAAIVTEEQPDSQEVTGNLDEQTVQNAVETPVAFPFSEEIAEPIVSEHLSESVKMSPTEPAASEKSVKTESAVSEAAEQAAYMQPETTEEAPTPTTMTYIEEEWENFSMPPQPTTLKPDGKTVPQKKAITPTPSPAPKDRAIASAGFE